MPYWEERKGWVRECLRRAVVVVVVVGSRGRKDPRLADYQWAPRESALITDGPQTSYHGAPLTSRPLSTRIKQTAHVHALSVLIPSAFFPH